MAKQKLIYECTSCGHQIQKWQGKCPQCESWNSFVEALAQSKSSYTSLQNQSQEILLHEVSDDQSVRLETELKEFNYVMGGGVVPGSVTVLGGSPGIGKSTLILQVLESFDKQGLKSLYFSGEESPQQIKMRASRLGILSKNLILSTEIELNKILQTIDKHQVNIIVIDSIQTIYQSDLEASPGSLAQIRESTFQLVKKAKENGLATFIVGHVTKEGQIAGPKVLEHMVDVVLYFEGDGLSNSRILRSVKNRFGASNELALFNMTEKGLSESDEYSYYLLNKQEMQGVTLSCIREGSRHMLVEIQALVSRANYGMPQRVANGIDQKRLNVIIAVLEKKAGLFLGDQDIFIKVSSAVKVNDPAADLAIAAAIWSSFSNRSFKQGTVFMGELALTGHLQNLSYAKERIKDAKKFGFSACVIGKQDDLNAVDGLIMFEHIQQIQDLLF